MLRTLHRFDKGSGRLIESIEVDFMDGYPIDYWRLPDDQTAEALPKYDKAKEVPVWDGKGWVVTPLSFFEPEPEPEPEPSILDPDNLIKAVIALIDAVEKQEPIPQETKTLVEAERVKLAPVVEEPIIKEITK